MERVVVREEDDAPSKNWENAIGTLSHLFIPELQVASVLFLPVVVEVDENIEAAVDLQEVVLVKVRMDLEKAPPPDLVEAAPLKIGVRDDACDPGY